MHLYKHMKIVNISYFVASDLWKCLYIVTVANILKKKTILYINKWGIFNILKGQIR